MWRECKIIIFYENTFPYVVFFFFSFFPHELSSKGPDSAALYIDHGGMPAEFPWDIHTSSEARYSSSLPISCSSGEKLGDSSYVIFASRCMVSGKVSR